MGTTYAHELKAGVGAQQPNSCDCNNQDNYAYPNIKPLILIKYITIVCNRVIFY